MARDLSRPPLTGGGFQPLLPRKPFYQLLSLSDVKPNWKWRRRSTKSSSFKVCHLLRISVQV